MNTNPSQYNRKDSFSNNYSSIENTSENKFFLIPLVLIVAFLPLIVRYYEYDPKLSGYVWFLKEKVFDAYLYWKQFILLIIASVMVLLIGLKVYIDKKSVKFSFVLIPLIIYGILALLSTYFSDYSSFGITGIFEQFESVFTLLSYCLIVYYSFLFVQNENDIRFIFKYLIIGIIVLSILGLTQFIGHDFLNTDIGHRLVLPRKYWGNIGIDLKFGLHRVYLTLYNPNYVGVYTSMIIPILLCLLFKEKNKKQIILYSLAILGMLICLIGSQSKTSIISLFVSFIFIIFLFRKYIFKKSKITLAIIGTAIISVFLLTVINMPVITNLVNQLTHIEKTEPALTDIKTEEELTITYKGNDLIVNLLNDVNGIYFLPTDSTGNIIPYNTSESGLLVLDDSRFSDISFAYGWWEDLVCLQFTIEGKDWLFTNQLGDNTFYYVNANGKFDKINTTDSNLFKGYEKFASGRGYIWSRAISLLKDNIILGTGADTFVFAFPQQDYVNLFNAGLDNQLVTRPHNLYLQMGVQTGVLSLLAFLLFYIIYFVTSIRLYWKGVFENYYYKAGVSIFVGTIAYMIAGISNDSTVTVAPVFWVLIGIGTAINHKLKSDIKSSKLDSNFEL